MWSLRRLSIRDLSGKVVVAKRPLLRWSDPGWTSIRMREPRRIVESVMVDGRWLMRDRRVLTLDEPAIVAEAERVARAAWTRLFAERPDLKAPPGLDLSLR